MAGIRKKAVICTRVSRVVHVCTTTHANEQVNTSLCDNCSLIFRTSSSNSCRPHARTVAAMVPQQRGVMLYRTCHGEFEQIVVRHFCGRLQHVNQSSHERSKHHNDSFLIPQRGHQVHILFIIRQDTVSNATQPSSCASIACRPNHTWPHLDHYP